MTCPSNDCDCECLKLNIAELDARDQILSARIDALTDIAAGGANRRIVTYLIPDIDLTAAPTDYSVLLNPLCLFLAAEVKIHLKEIDNWTVGINAAPVGYSNAADIPGGMSDWEDALLFTPNNFNETSTITFGDAFINPLISTGFDSIAIIPDEAAVADVLVADIFITGIETSL